MRILSVLPLALALIALSCRAHPSLNALDAQYSNSGYVPHLVFIDCNGNGRSDSLDLAERIAFDLDGDGAMDDCFADSMSQAVLVDSLHLESVPIHTRVTYLRDRSIELAYFLPAAARRVQVIAQIDGDSVRALVDAPADSGLYSLRYPSQGRPALPLTGVGEFQIFADSVKWTRKLAWDWSRRR